MCDFEKIMYSIARSPSPMQVKNFFSFDKLTENFTVQHVFDRENFVRSIEYLDSKSGITGYQDQTFANHEFIK